MAGAGYYVFNYALSTGTPVNRARWSSICP